MIIPFWSCLYDHRCLLSLGWRKSWRHDYGPYGLFPFHPKSKDRSIKQKISVLTRTGRRRIESTESNESRMSRNRFDRTENRPHWLTPDMHDAVDVPYSCSNTMMASSSLSWRWLKKRRKEWASICCRLTQSMLLLKKDLCNDTSPGTLIKD